MNGIIVDTTGKVPVVKLDLAELPDNYHMVGWDSSNPIDFIHRSGFVRLPPSPKYLACFIEMLSIRYGVDERVISPASIDYLMGRFNESWVK